MENNTQMSSFYVVRDDLLHQLVNGNKARKLDALFPLLEDHLVTDVLSHVLKGLKSYLLLRGEQLDISTGYNLISTIYGDVTYVPRSLSAKREEMLKSMLIRLQRPVVLWCGGAIFFSPVQRLKGLEI
ncbi:hypothetical protein RJ641_002711 [Dillenia turbinata]|uniref:Uncharacterized protein n=1 Tax=Dillenia turbinata TaxID=194707 RepID=A0AAN8ZEL9_9MAGN